MKRPRAAATPSKLAADIAKDEYDGWFQTKWRPAMAWQYLIVCLFDFMVAPIMNAIYSTWSGSPFVAWESLTLSNGGMYHVAMGAVVGVAAWTRGNEKMKMMEHGLPRRREWYAEDREGQANNGKRRPAEDGGALTGDEGDFETGPKRKGKT